MIHIDKNHRAISDADETTDAGQHALELGVLLDADAEIEQNSLPFEVGWTNAF